MILHTSNQLKCSQFQLLLPSEKGKGVSKKSTSGRVFLIELNTFMGSVKQGREEKKKKKASCWIPVALK